MPHLIRAVLAALPPLLLATAAAAGPSLSAQHQAALRQFTSGTEPLVKDAIWTADRMFKVGVLDNGTPRDGYAQYVCESLYDHGFKGRQVSVHVVDIALLKRTGKWVRLGEARCK